MQRCAMAMETAIFGAKQVKNLAPTLTDCEVTCGWSIVLASTSEAALSGLRDRSEVETEGSFECAKRFW